MRRQRGGSGGGRHPQAAAAKLPPPSFHRRRQAAAALPATAKLPPSCCHCCCHQIMFLFMLISPMIWRLVLIRCEKKMKSVFLKTTSRSGCGLSGWSFCSPQKQTTLLLDLSVLFFYESVANAKSSSV
jgi:hypothetical protein